MSSVATNLNQLNISDDDELILSFDDEYPQPDSQSIPFDGVDMAQSITCSSAQPRYFPHDNFNLLDQCQKETVTVNKRINMSNEPFIAYSQIFQLICENEHLRKENQTLKKTIQQNNLQTSTRKSKNLAFSHRKQSKNDTKSIFQNAKSSIYNSTVQKFNFLQSFSKCSSSIQKIRNLIILEQFCKVKSTQQTVDSLVQDIDSLFQEFARHQRAYQRQISSLRKLNQNLSLILEDTDQKLEILLTQLNKTPVAKRRQFSSNKNEYKTQTNIQKGSYSPSFSSEVPYFAKTFSHSMEQIEFISTVQQELSLHHPQHRECIESFVKIVFWIKERLVKGQTNLEINPINLAKSNKLKLFIQDIQKAIEKLQRIQFKQQFFRRSNGNNLQSNIALQQFLKCFSSNISLFLKKIESSKQKSGVLLNILLSAYISFIEIYFSEWKCSRMNTSIGNEYIGKFWRIMTCLKMKSGISNSADVENYLEEMRHFLDNLNQS